MSLKVLATLAASFLLLSPGAALAQQPSDDSANEVRLSEMIRQISRLAEFNIVIESGVDRFPAMDVEVNGWNWREVLQLAYEGRLHSDHPTLEALLDQVLIIHDLVGERAPGYIVIRKREPAGLRPPAVQQSDGAGSYK